jgi:hypothetical protein
MGACAPPSKRDAMILSSHGCKTSLFRNRRIVARRDLPHHAGLIAGPCGFRKARPLRSVGEIADNRCSAEIRCAKEPP